MAGKDKMMSKDMMATSKSATLPSETSHMIAGQQDSEADRGRRPSRSSNSKPYSGGNFENYVADHLHRMHHDIENTTRKLELERRRLHTLDEALRGAEDEFAKKREKYKMWQSANEDEVAKSEGKLRKLESRLDKAISELNKGEHSNIELRDQIDQLRKERRQVLDPEFKKLQRDIGTETSKLQQLHQQHDVDKTDHHEAKFRASALQKKLEKERVDFKAQCELAQTELHQQDKIQKAMEMKSSILRQNNKGGNKRTYMVADEEDDFSETAVERRILKLSFLNCIQRRHIKQHQKNIEVFEQAFATIKSSTGISDIEEIVKIFVKLEERNFSLLTYVNQLNREIESIEMRNCALNKQLKEYNAQEEQAAARKRAALADLSTQVKKTQMAAGDKDRMVEEAALSLVECRPLIWSLVKQIHDYLPNLANAAGEESFAELTSPDEHEDNLNNFLTFIENAVLHFKVAIPNCDVTQVARPQAKRSNDRNIVVKPNDLPNAKFDNDSEDDEDGCDPMSQLPLNRSELKSTVERLLMKRRNRNRNMHAGQKGDDRRQMEESSSAQQDKQGQPDSRSGGVAKSPSMVVGKAHDADDGTAAPEDHFSDRSKLNWRKEGPVTEQNRAPTKNSRT